MKSAVLSGKRIPPLLLSDDTVALRAGVESAEPKPAPRSRWAVMNASTGSIKSLAFQAPGLVRRALKKDRCDPFFIDTVDLAGIFCNRPSRYTNRGIRLTLVGSSRVREVSA